MSMRVDSNIVNALNAYLQKNELGYREFARKTGVSPAAITKWRKVGNGITDAKWKQIFPYIKPYLPQDRIYIDDSGTEQYSSNTEHVSAYVFEPKYIPTTVPQISLADVLEYDNLLEPPIQFGKKLKAPMVECHHKIKQGVLSVVVDKNAFNQIFPFGANVFVCASAQPQHNNFVMVKTVNNDLLMGRFVVNNDDFSLVNVINGKTLLSGKIRNARNIISWAFPVLYYEAITF